MTLVPESTMHETERWLWEELAERHRTSVLHAAAFALFDDVRPEWEAWLSTHELAPPPPPPSPYLRDLLV